MKRYDILEVLMKYVKDDVLVVNIGIPSKEVYHIHDKSSTFYMLGSMGLASSIALGLAIAKPKTKIWCVDGDGSILMNLGSLATIGNLAPPNLNLVVIDNGAYGSTGSQKTKTSELTDLQLIAKGAGFKHIIAVENGVNLDPYLSNLKEQCNFIHIRCNLGNEDVQNIPMSALEIKERFMTSIVNR